MIFAILFVIAFFVGLLAYLFTGKWLIASLISTGLFVLNALTDSHQSDNLFFTLVLGLPVVFSASLLGAYVVELRRGFDVDDDQSLSESNVANSDAPESTSDIEKSSTQESKQ